MSGPVNINDLIQEIQRHELTIYRITELIDAINNGESINIGVGSRDLFYIDKYAVQTRGCFLLFAETVKILHEQLLDDLYSKETK